MQRIDGPTAVPTLPVPAATGTPGYFGQGNLAAGLRPTTMSADWANMMQEEVMSVITAASIAPDKTNHTQLLTAINSLITTAVTAGRPVVSGNASSGSVNYGTCLDQWMEVSVGNGTHSFSWPTPFSNSCLRPTLTIINADGGTINGSASVGFEGDPTATGGTFWVNSGSGSASFTVKISALGK